MNYSYKCMILITLLLSTAHDVSTKGKNPHLQRIHIRNNYKQTINCDLQWRDRHGTHTRRWQNIHLEKGPHTFKAPLLGYYLEKIIVSPILLVLPRDLRKDKERDIIKAGKNSSFIITKDYRDVIHIYDETSYNLINPNSQPTPTGYSAQPANSDARYATKEAYDAALNANPDSVMAA